MKHYGDITKLNGAELPAVDVITGGSPCQDLSVAGKRAGLAGERSGLFMEQIRVIKEMRQRDRDSGRAGKLIRPRYMVWENVPGAFSSNGGEDFRAVLEETAHIADEKAVVPQPPNGKWTTSGAIMGDGWSIAWRVLDAQFWGVPQRRRRIALVADFGEQSAPEILFIRNGLSWDIAESRAARERTAGDAETGAGSAVCVRMREGCIDRADTAGCNGKGWTEDVSYTLNTTDCPEVFDARGNGDGSIVPTMIGDHNGHISDYTALCIGNGQANQSADEIAGALNCMHDQQAVATFQNTGRGWWNESDVAECIRTPCGGDSAKANIASNGHAVRRLTPLECERLQGYPDGWTDIGEWTDSKGKVHKPSDSARYKALGNSIALPPWRWVLLRITAQYERPATLGSLFDGIGGFPLIWERLNGDGACLWASEIEEFCIAVTRLRFERTEQV